MGEYLAKNMIKGKFSNFFCDSSQMMLKLGMKHTMRRNLVKFTKIDDVISNSKV